MPEGPLGIERPFVDPPGWRSPTDEEKEDLIDWIMENRFMEFEREIEREETREDEELTIDRYSETGRIAVKEDYVSDTPGYRGRIIFMIQGVSDAVSVFRYDRQGNNLKLIVENEF